jgi:hypothetical protein
MLTSTTFVDTAVVNGNTYFYVMTSFQGSTESAESSEVSAIPGSTGIIRGTVRYEDKEYGRKVDGSFGFTGTRSWKAVRYATVDVVNDVTEDVLYTTQTDSQGNYAIVTSPSTTQVYVRINSSSTPPLSGTIRVRDLSNNAYGVPSDPFPLSGSAFVAVSVSVSNVAGAFNILDVMTTGYDLVRELSGSYPSSPLSTYWAPGNTAGTYYCTGFECSPGDGIYVLSETGGDTDEFDDDILWHEFGHFLASTFSRDQSPGGYHSLGDNDHDLRFSWSEGWGNFIPGALKSWLAANDPLRLSTPPGQSNTLYTDTYGASSGWSFDFGTAPALNQYFYASGEVAVAKVLLRLRELFSLQDIWDIVTSFLSSTPSTPVNMELFWDRWMASKPPSTGGITVQSVFEERQILYRDDAYEQDDSLATAVTITVGMLQSNRTLFSDGDSDYVRFTPQGSTSYTIRTSSLRNGADTHLELYNDLGTLIPGKSNDNDKPPYTCNINAEVCHENGNDALSSTLSFSSATPPAGPYTIRVYSAPLKPASAGRYGTYNLIVTAP